MTELSDVPMPVFMMGCGTVLLIFGDPFGRDLITLAVGMAVGQ